MGIIRYMLVVVYIIINIINIIKLQVIAQESGQDKGPGDPSTQPDLSPIPHGQTWRGGLTSSAHQPVPHPTPGAWTWYCHVAISH